MEKFCKIRGKAWEIMTMACLPIMQLLDWQRCMPYSIKEISHVFGLEAAKGVMLQVMLESAPKVIDCNTDIPVRMFYCFISQS